MNSRQLQLLATLVLVIGSASSLQAGTTELSDCASLGPENAQQGVSWIIAACQGEGTCGDGTGDYSEVEQSSATRCHRTITTDADPEGNWEWASDTPTPAVMCQTAVGDCEGMSAETGESVSTTETASVSVGVSMATTAGVAAKAALLGEVSVEIEVGFDTNAETSSEVSKTFTTTGTVSAPCCGKKIGHLSAFKKNLPASGTLVLRYQIQCRDDDGELCDGTNWHILNSQSYDITLDAKDTTKQWLVCDSTCSTVHQCCDGSATTTPVPPCQYKVWGDDD